MAGLRDGDSGKGGKLCRAGPGQPGTDRQGESQQLALSSGAGLSFDGHSGLQVAGAERLQRVFRTHFLPSFYRYSIERAIVWGAEVLPGNVHSAKGCAELLSPEIEREAKLGTEVVFRVDAALAKPEIYEALEEQGVRYAIRIPANNSLIRDIEESLTTLVRRSILIV